MMRVLECGVGSMVMPGMSSKTVRMARFFETSAQLVLRSVSLWDLKFGDPFVHDVLSRDVSVSEQNLAQMFPDGDLRRGGQVEPVLTTREAPRATRAAVDLVPTAPPAACQLG
ncbi:hypothetical protein GCM10028800_14290 [Nesterenkonia populi]